MHNEEEGTLGTAIDLEPLLTQAPPPIQWAVKGLLAEGDIAIFSGAGGIGKSYLQTAMAISLSQGKPLFGQFQVTRPYRNLYLDLEMADTETSRRFSRMLQGAKATKNDLKNLHVFSRGDLILDNPKLLVRLNDFIRDNQIDFVFIDSMRRVIKGDENDSATANRLLKTTRFFRDQYGCGFIFLAHHRKPKEDQNGFDPSNALRGTGDWRNITDTHSAIYPHKLPDHLMFVPDKSRHEEVLDQFAIKFDHFDRFDENGPFTMTFVPDGGLEELEIAIVNILRITPNLTNKEIMENLHDSKLTTKRLRIAMDRLVSGKIIHPDHRGRGKVAIRYRVNSAT